MTLCRAISKSTYRKEFKNMVPVGGRADLGQQRNDVGVMKPSHQRCLVADRGFVLLRQSTLVNNSQSKRFSMIQPTSANRTNCNVE